MEEKNSASIFAEELLKQFKKHQDVKEVTFDTRKQTKMQLGIFNTACLSSSLLIGRTVGDFGKAISTRRDESKRDEFRAAVADIESNKYGLFKKPTLAARLIDIFRSKDLPQFEGSNLEKFLTQRDPFKHEVFSKDKYEFTKDLPPVQRYLCRTLMLMEEGAPEKSAPLTPVLATIIFTRNRASQDEESIDKTNAAIDQLENLLEPYVLAFINKGMAGSVYASRAELVGQSVETVQKIFNATAEKKGEPAQNVAAYLHDLALHSKLFGTQFRDSLAAASFVAGSDNQLRYVNDQGRLSLVFTGADGAGYGEVEELPAGIVSAYGEDFARLLQVVKTNLENGDNGKAVWDALKVYSDSANGTDNEKALKVAVYGTMLVRYSGLSEVNPDASSQLLESLADVYGEVRDSKDITKEKFAKIVDEVIKTTTEKFMVAKECTLDALGNANLSGTIAQYKQALEDANEALEEAQAAIQDQEKVEDYDKLKAAYEAQERKEMLEQELKDLSSIEASKYSEEELSVGEDDKAAIVEMEKALSELGNEAVEAESVVAEEPVVDFTPIVVDDDTQAILKEENENLRLANGRLTEENRTLKQQLDEVTAENSALVEENNALTAENQELKNRNANPFASGQSTRVVDPDQDAQKKVLRAVLKLGDKLLLGSMQRDRKTGELKRVHKLNLGKGDAVYYGTYEIKGDTLVELSSSVAALRDKSEKNFDKNAPDMAKFIKEDIAYVTADKVEGKNAAKEVAKDIYISALKLTPKPERKPKQQKGDEPEA